MKDNKDQQKPEEAVEEVATEETTAPETTAEVTSEPATETSDQDEKIAELINDLQRTRADFENFRRQNDKQREQDRDYAKLDTVRKFLPLIDDFERAISANPKELSPLAKNFEKTLNELNLEKIDSEPGAEFNPDLHQAISVNGDGEKEVISETLRAGYYYNNEVLRPAMVRVSKS